MAKTKSKKAKNSRNRRSNSKNSHSDNSFESLYYTESERQEGVRYSSPKKKKHRKKDTSDSLDAEYKRHKIDSIDNLEERIGEVKSRRKRDGRADGRRKNPEDELLIIFDSMLTGRVKTEKRIKKERKSFSREEYFDVERQRGAGSNWTDDIRPYDPTPRAYKELLKERAGLRKGIHKPGAGARFDNLARTLFLMGQNAFDITFGKWVVDGWSEHAKKSLGKGDKVYILLHGTSQNAGAFRERVKQLTKEGYKVIALNYDYRKALGDLDSASEWLNKEIEEVKRKTGRSVYGVEGHSLGAMLAQYTSMKYHYTGDDVGNTVLSSGVYEGTEDTWQKKLVESIESNIDEISPRHRRGREKMLFLNGRMPKYKKRQNNTAVITVAGTGDRLVNPEASMHVDARENYVVPSGTHFDGAGGNRQYGKNIIQLVKGEEKRGWEFKDFVPEREIYERTA